MTLLSNPVFLGWLLAASLPLVLWWLFRRRRAVVQWSANYVLRKAMQASAMRNLWRQVVILALRVLVIALVVLALARPFVKEPADPNALPHGDGSLHQVVLVDTSDSMGIKYGSYTREEEVATRLDALLRRLRPGDTCDVIPLTPGPEGRLTAIPVSCPVSSAELRRVAQSLVRTDRPAAWLDGLQLASERFFVTSSNTRQLVILSDVSRKDLPATAELDILHQELERMAVRVVTYEVRDRPRPNLAVLGVQVGAGTLFAGWQYHVYLDVRNFGETPAQTAMTIEVLAGTTRLSIQQTPLDLGANEQRLVDFPVRLPPEGGLVTIRATVQDEAYQPDNVREFNVHVQPQLRVLLVTGPAEAEVRRPLWRDSWYFQNALTALARSTGDDGAGGGPKMTGGAFVRDPATGAMVQKSADEMAAAGAGDDAPPSLVVSLRKTTAEALTPADVDGADVVVFSDVSTVDRDVVSALDRRVRQGGGVLFGMGDSVYEDAFNESFGGLSPVRLDRRHVATARDRQDWDYDAPYVQIEKTFEHPLLRTFLSDSQGLIENVRVYNYEHVATPTATAPAAATADPASATTWMTLSNGDPLLLARHHGRGTTMLYTSSLGGSWNTLPVRNMYVNLVYAWMTGLSGGEALPRNLDVGDPLMLPADREAVYIGGDPLPATVGPLVRKTVNGKGFYRFDGLAAPGDYLLLDGATEFGRVRVQHATVESDTRGLDEISRAALEPHLGGPILHDWSGMAGALHTDELRGWSAIGLLVLVALVFLLTDALLTRIWFR